MEANVLSQAVRFGSLVDIPRGIIVLVNVQDDQLVQMHIPKIDELNMLQIKEFTRKKIINLKQCKDKDINFQMLLLRIFPMFIIQLICYMNFATTYILGMSSKIIGVKSYGFGSGLFTNITQFKLADNIFAPRVQFANTNFLLTLHKPNDEARVEEGEIVVRKIMKANFTIDQRFANNLDLRKLQRDFLSVWEAPEKHLGDLNQKKSEKHFGDLNKEKTD